MHAAGSDVTKFYKHLHIEIVVCTNRSVLKKSIRAWSASTVSPHTYIHFKLKIFNSILGSTRSFGFEFNFISYQIYTQHTAHSRLQFWLEQFIKFACNEQVISSQYSSYLEMDINCFFVVDDGNDVCPPSSFFFSSLRCFMHAAAVIFIRPNDTSAEKMGKTSDFGWLNVPI